MRSNLINEVCTLRQRLDLKRGITEKSMKIKHSPVKTEAEWREVGRIAQEVKLLLNRLLVAPIPRRTREPHILRAIENIDKFCSNTEDELMRQIPAIEDPTHVFYAQTKTTNAHE
jgi:hypothetical protein